MVDINRAKGTKCFKGECWNRVNSTDSGFDYFHIHLGCVVVE